MNASQKNKNLADKIVMFFERHDEMGGATSEELYDATLRALEQHDEDGIKIMKDYFRDLSWADKRAQEIFRELDIDY